LCRHRWPGNIRELQNVVAGLVLAAPARGPVTARHVAEVLQGGGEVAPEPLAAARRRGDIRIVTAALARHAGCRAAAARDLGVSRQGLGKLMIRLGIGDEVATGTVLR
jgi:two-component system NtrC family response regulator